MEVQWLPTLTNPALNPRGVAHDEGVRWNIFRNDGANTDDGSGDLVVRVSRTAVEHQGRLDPRADLLEQVQLQFGLFVLGIDAVRGADSDGQRVDAGGFDENHDIVRIGIDDFVGAGLGVVELTVALHAVFSAPKDKIIWDVGHQCYPHKLITGRNKGFETLRQSGGISGFPDTSESPFDLFNVGHAGTSIDGSGLLTISTGETSRTLTVTATSTCDTGKSGRSRGENQPAASASSAPFGSPDTYRAAKSATTK